MRTYVRCADDLRYANVSRHGGSRNAGEAKQTDKREHDTNTRRLCIVVCVSVAHMNIVIIVIIIRVFVCGSLGDATAAGMRQT